jgi:hypothetical protein
LRERTIKETRNLETQYMILSNICGKQMVSIITLVGWFHIARQSDERKGCAGRFELPAQAMCM